MNDPMTVAVAMGGSVAGSQIVMMALQNLKSLFPGLHGRAMEWVVAVVALIATVVTYLLVSPNWMVPATYGLIAATWIAAWSGIRAQYASMVRGIAKSDPEPAPAPVYGEGA